jgi:hypothetical protein
VPGRCKAVVKFDYTSRDPVELTIHAGDVITVLNEDSSGWWKGNGQSRERRGSEEERREMHLVVRGCIATIGKRTNQL